MAPQLKGRLMDFGCGKKPYQSLFKVDEYIGVDMENPGHSHVNESIDVFYDGKTLPFEDEYFDSIFTSEVFEHIFNLPESLLELNRVLKTNGLILITCPFAYCEHEAPNDYARYTSFAMKYMLSSNGFEMVSQIKTGNSIETIFQLWTTYVHLHILPVFRKIPLVRSVVRYSFIGLTNLLALFFSKLLPSGKDLYLNNVVLCRKTKHVAL